MSRQDGTVVYDSGIDKVVEIVQIGLIKFVMNVRIVVRHVKNAMAVLVDMSGMSIVGGSMSVGVGGSVGWCVTIARCTVAVSSRSAVAVSSRSAVAVS